jgi:hypothetical protein
MKFAYARIGSSMANIGNRSGIQLWTVPKTGNYRFDIAGAKGGDSAGGYNGGKGRVVYVTCRLTQGQQVQILVGQAGGTMERGGGVVGAGGGGSFVVIDNTIIGIGGGGGGAKYGPQYNSNTTGRDAPAATNGTDVRGNAGQNNGAGGSYSGGNSYTGGGGGGWSGNGRADISNGWCTSIIGLSWGNGMLGGMGCMYANDRGAADGGFGGGGGAWINNEPRPGGGGGFSGGDGAHYQAGSSGGGGGSSLGNLNSISTAVYGDVNNGEGYVTVWNADAQTGWVQPLDGIWMGQGWGVKVVIGGGRITGGTWGNQPITGGADGTYSFPTIGGNPPFKKGATDLTASWNGYDFKKNPDIRGTWASAEYGISVQFDYDAGGTWRVTGGTWGGNRTLTYTNDGASFKLPDIGGGEFTVKSPTTASWAGTTMHKQ